MVGRFLHGAYWHPAINCHATLREAYGYQGFVMVVIPFLIKNVVLYYIEILKMVIAYRFKKNLSKRDRKTRSQLTESGVNKILN